MITSNVDGGTMMKLKGKHTQVTEEALMNTLTVVQTAAINVLSDASYIHIKNTLTQMTFKGTGDNVSARNLERWSQTPKSMDVFMQRVLN